MTTRFHPAVSEAIIVVLLFVGSAIVSDMAMRGFRAAGAQPLFYQANFEPAVMMACGRGFVTSPSAPQELVDFLNVARNDFDCGGLPTTMAQVPLTSPANANWYYLYGAAAAVWKMTGVSWTALDYLVSVLGALVTVLLYGLFRLITGRGASAALAVLLTISPANLTHLLSLRDYSKAPFVLGAVLILAALIIRPMRRAGILLLAAAYGVVVGIGYGFRGDLAVMVPFGAAIVFLFLPGAFRSNALRNATASGVLLLAFGITAWPVIRGLQLGGCQYHFALLGLTDPLTSELRLTPSLYRVGAHLSDTFADLKVGDYAARVLHAPVPQLCSAEYDAASRPLYLQLARTFPADFVVRAYASVLQILRVSLAIPDSMVPMAPFSGSGAMTALYGGLSAITSPLGPLGVLLTLAAVAGAFGSSLRLGLALTVCVLFLTGYPAIRFDERHWFHLRFIAWWAAALVATHLVRSGAGSWPAARLIRAGAATALLIGLLVAALTAVRAVQTGRVERLVADYLRAPREILTTRVVDPSSMLVDWRPRDYGTPPAHRGSDLIAVTLDAAACGGTGPLDLTVRYDANVPSHDMSATYNMSRPVAGGPAPTLFVPVFWQADRDSVWLRFSGFGIANAPVACIGQVARVADAADLPLWVELNLPADWASHRLYESMRPPRIFNH